MKKNDSVVRMTISADPKSRKAMEVLSKKTGLGISGTIRRAMAIYQTLLKERSEGATIIIRKGKTERELIVLGEETSFVLSDT